MRPDSLGHGTGDLRLQCCTEATCSLETRSQLLGFWASTSDALGEAALLQEQDGQQLPPSPSCQSPAPLGTPPEKSSLYQHKCSLLAAQSPRLSLLQALNNSILDKKAPAELRGPSGCSDGLMLCN